MEQGLIVPSYSSAGAPLFFVTKKTGDLRPCIDYRALNAVTVRDRNPLPLIQDILDSVSSSIIFTKIDLRGVYHLLRIRTGDEWKTTFRTPFGLFKYRVMPFGLVNAPAIFQCFMDAIFSDLLMFSVIVYLDDILIFSQNREQHYQNTKEVLERLSRNNLSSKPEKCAFGQNEVD